MRVSATDLLDWRPRVVRAIDPRQADLFDGQGREVEARSPPHHARCNAAAPSLHVAHGQVARIDD
jgi:hypothetical protein